jgi:hypothetical protein
MELLNKLKVSRRFALRGALGGIGVAMWLPVLDAMCNNNGTAFAAGEDLPTTFGVWFWGNGIHVDQWTPSGTGDAWQLPKALEAFAEVKDSMTLVTGLDMLDAKFKGHGWGVVYVLAGGDGTICNVTSDIDKTPSHRYETTVASQYQRTIDQLIADGLIAKMKENGQEEHLPSFPSLETGMIPFTGDVAMGTVGSNLAHRGPNDYLPPKRDPKVLFDHLFKDFQAPDGGGGTGGSTGMPSDISLQTRRSVLDAVMADANRLKATVGTEDAKRIDSHLEGIRALEMSIPKVSGTGGTGGGTGGPVMAACTVPEAPATLEEMTAKSQAINRLIVAALACNRTRVFSHLWSGPRSDSTYPVIQLNGAHHAYTHGNDGQEPRAIERYIMSQYAHLAKLMKDTPIGDSNLLNQTLIYGISDVAEPAQHIMTNWHVVLMGRAGGKVAGNRYVRIPGRKVTELGLTMQQLMGLPVTTWGSWDKTSKTIPEILT